MSQPTSSRHESVVLIVEDSRTISSELKRTIEGELGFNTEVASSFEEAQAFIKEHSQDVFVAILDLHLPDSPDGAIVDLFCAMDVPCIVFTSDITDATRKKMRSKEIIDYVVKDAHAVRNILSYINRLDKNRSIRILVVEDSESSRYMICSLLKKQMFQVIDVEDAESALKVLESHDDIKMVLTDNILPGMTGIQMVKVIRRTRGKDVLPIIGLSSSSDPTLTALFIKMGANDFIAKPFEPEEFFCRVNHNIDTLLSFQALKSANDERNTFLGMVVHDLRSPINGINGLSQMLLENLCGELTDEQRELIQFIHDANKQMNQQVGDLLDLSVIESGRLRLQKEQANLAALIDERLRIHGIGAKKKVLRIERNLSDIPSFPIDCRRMGQVLDNLLTNAIKYSPSGESIEISLGVKNGKARLCVQDHGQGIPAGEERLLFHNFATTSVRPTAGETSVGLGLAITKKIVEAHGGRIWVESESGKGANFCFEIPLE